MDLVPGTQIERLIPSTTGRDIQPGDIGVVDTYNGPGAFCHVQWLRTGLWSMMHPDQLGVRFKLLE